MSSEVLQVLSNSLNSDSSTRIAAELRLADLFVNPQTPLELTNASLEQDLDLSVASIALRKYINERWSPYFPSFKGPPPSYEVKAQIRPLLLRGLSDPNPKIRSLIAHSLSTLAHSDWPDDYPELLKDLIKLLSSSSTDSVHGAMQVFVEFIRSDVSEDQILPVLRELLPVLMNILLSRANTPLTRSQAVKVFAQCVESLYMVKDQHPQATREAISSILPDWVAAFHRLLSEDPRDVATRENSWDHLAIRLQIYRCLSVILTVFPSSLGNTIMDILTISFQILQVMSPLFLEYHLSSNDGLPGTEGNDTLTLPQLAASIFDFVTSCSRGGKAKPWFSVANNVTLCIETIFIWTQITQEDEIAWENDLSLFLENDEEDPDAVGPRSAGFDLINSLIDRWPNQLAFALHTGLNQVIRNVSDSREKDAENWWKPIEAALACSASIAGDIIELAEEKKEKGEIPPFDPSELLVNFIPSLLENSDCPLLQGRCLVFASKFSSYFSSAVASRYGNLSAQVIESQRAGLPLKLSAVKAIRNIYEESGHAMLGNEAPHIVRVLGPILDIANDNIVCVVLETLRAVLVVQEGSWLETSLTSYLTASFLAVWRKNLRDPVICSVLEDNFEILAQDRREAVFNSAASLAIPTFIEAMASSSSDLPWIATSALEFTTKFVANQIASKDLVVAVLRALFKSVESTQDRDIQQAGVQCLNELIKRHASVCFSWLDEGGRSGLDCTLALIAVLLDPTEEECGGLVVGDLIINLLRRAGDAILSPLPALLQAMINRMATANTPTFIQSLIIPFALLIQMHQDSTLDFLEKATVAVSDATQSRSGLEVLLQTWCENAESIQGDWATKISIMTLSQLFLSQKDCLRGVMVKGDMIIRPETRDVTRSRAKQTPHLYSSISFSIKALKLILNELQSGNDTGVASMQEVTDLDSDDGDGDWADEELLIQGFKPAEFALISEMLGTKGKNFEGEERGGQEFEEYPEFPVSKIDLKEYIISFLREIASKNTNEFNSLVDHLSAEEVLVLRQALKQ